MSSSSSEDHEYYSGEEVDFGDEPTLPDTSKFSHISEEEMQVYVPVMVPPSGEITTTEGISFILLNCLPIKLGRCFNVSFEFLLQERLSVSEVTTSCHIEEMIQELAQQEGLEVPTTGMPREGVTTEIGEPSSLSGLSKDLPFSYCQLGK